MEGFTPRQIVFFIAAMLVAGAVTAWGTTYVLERFVLSDPTDPLTKHGGLSPGQRLGQGTR